MPKSPPYVESVRRALVGSGLTMREIARRAGVSPGQVSRFIRRMRGVMTPTLERLGDVAGVEIVVVRKKPASRRKSK